MKFSLLYRNITINVCCLYPRVSILRQRKLYSYSQFIPSYRMKVLTHCNRPHFLDFALQRCKLLSTNACSISNNLTLRSGNTLTPATSLLPISFRYLSTESGHGTTHFGFKTVKEEEKVDKVYEVFRNVADSYDLMNDVMSVGIHRLWKDEFISKLAPMPGSKLIDVAGGTGDIAFRFLKYIRNSTGTTEHDSRVTVCDINDHMLKVGEERALQHSISSGITWLQGNAECLPVDDCSYDAYTIAFGIRNCTDIKKVLSEAYRVLKPGGRFMCLEFSQVRNPLLRMLYDEYSFQVIPVMGHVIAQDWNSYQYLVESIRRFPDQESFAAMIEEVGFKEVSVTDLTFGVVSIHSGFKI